MRYARVLLKLSGEVLAGGRGFGIDGPTLEHFAGELADVARAGVQLAVVIGGGNIFRGVQGATRGVDRVTGDYMGMLATVINACSMADVLERRGVPARVLSALGVPQVAELYVRRRALEDVEKARRFALDRFAGDLLAVKDSLEAALATGDNASLESVKNGVELTLKQLSGVFEKNAINEISPLGDKFDPNRHQAIGMVEADGEPNSVAQVLQKGYTLNERVIRPALVMVVKPK